MNWKKGFVRLWIAVSLLCLPYPAYVLVNDVRDANDRYRVRMVHFNDQYGWADEPYVAGEDEPPQPPPWLAPERREKAKAERRRDEAWALRGWHEDVQRTIQQFLILGIGPPMALLVLSLVVTWIIVGFRQPVQGPRQD
jgi:hypothetical protein